MTSDSRIQSVPNAPVANAPVLNTIAAEVQHPAVAEQQGGEYKGWLFVTSNYGLKDLNQVTMMQFFTCESVAVLSVVLGAVLSSPPGTYFDCEKYPESQYQWDQIDRTRRICARGTEDGEDFIYCRHWECEKLECPEDEQITRDDGCKSCPGFCSSGGKNYPLGKSFRCADNVNTCRCLNFGLVSTRMGYFPESLCNATTINQ